MIWWTSNKRKVWTEKSRGETIVEVLLATVILSVIIAGAYTLSNRATRIGQSSIERTEAVNVVESMTEALRGVSYVRGAAWNEITDGYLTENKPSYADELTCAPPSSAFHLNIDSFDNFEGAGIVNNGVYESGHFQVWIEAYDPPDGPGGYADFHVRTCWEGISAAEMERVTAVLRLNTGTVGNWGEYAGGDPLPDPAPDPVTQTFANSSTGRSGSIYTWTVPTSGEYRITASGAQGGGTHGGYGARMSGVFDLNEGDTLQILVGQRGSPTSGYMGSGNNNASGGGGTFVALNNNPLIVAGGGGASYSTRHGNSNGRTAASGASGNGNQAGCSGGSGGGGGSGTCYSGSRPANNVGFEGGAGFSGNGSGGARSFLNGGFGGSSNAHGGFGGGGEVNNRGSWSRLGGGGGYSGGGASLDDSSGYSHGAGGGGSFNSGSSRTNIAGANSGHGRVTIQSVW